MKEKNATWPRSPVSRGETKKERRKGFTCIGEDDVGNCFKALIEV